MQPHQTPDADPTVMQKIALDIGEALAGLTNELSHHGRPRPSLDFGTTPENRWQHRRADLEAIIHIARTALFGTWSDGETFSRRSRSAPTFELAAGEERDEDDNLRVAVFFDFDSMVIAHPFWAAYEPSADPTEDWRLLTAYMQRLHVELVASIFEDVDPRHTLLKIYVMRPAVDAVAQALRSSNERPTISKSPYLVMELWSTDLAVAAKQIRAFLKERGGISATVKADAKGRCFHIKPTGEPVITVPYDDHLALDLINQRISVLSVRHVRAMFPWRD